ncbi:MAG: hypothetical protein OEW87_10035 [Flavobacteriaceae bacterium]|nr:hypothetical protein [Flavobacteriaceae bacterium]
MKLEVTKYQLEKMKEAIDTLSAMRGCYDMTFNEETGKQAKAFDNMLKKNNLKPRNFK